MVKNMKALALSSVVALIVAMGSLVVLLSLFSTGIKPAGEWIYCNVYFKLTSFITHASPPDFCKPQEKPEVVEIKETDNKAFSRLLLSYIISCWQSAEIKGLYKDHACYELRLKNRVSDVTEKDVSDVLIEEDDCTSIENSDYGCGEENKILWKVEADISITQQDLADAINSVTKPQEIPISSSNIPSEVTKIKNTAELRNYLMSDDFFQGLYANGLNYDSINPDKKKEIITITIGSEKYTYDVEDVLSELEKNGKISRAINSQSLILVRYNGARDAVEVIG